MSEAWESDHCNLDKVVRAGEKAQWTNPTNYTIYLSELTMPNKRARFEMLIPSHRKYL